MKAVVIFSGGLDSTVLAYQIKKIGYEPILLTFNYGQRHKKEIEFSKITALKLGAQHHIVDISSIKPLLPGSSLTDETIDTPHGNYSELNIKTTVVPNRNAIMLSIAYGCGIANDAYIVATGIHNGDHAVYPDCRPGFINKLQEAFIEGNQGIAKNKLDIFAPFITFQKHWIVKAGCDLDVPFEDTWSCYEGGDVHCGLCGTCLDRKNAFVKAEVKDPTTYAK